MTANMIKWMFCRLIYFGGYGHKLLTDIDSRNRSFIVDEASWVILAIFVLCFPCQLL